MQVSRSKHWVIGTSRSSVRAPFTAMEKKNPRIEMNMDVNMFSHFSHVGPLTRIPVFKLYEYYPVGVAERLVRGVIDSGAGMLRVSTKK